MFRNGVLVKAKNQLLTLASCWRRRIRRHSAADCTISPKELAYIWSSEQTLRRRVGKRGSGC